MNRRSTAWFTVTTLALAACGGPIELEDGAIRDGAVATMDGGADAGDASPNEDAGDGATTGADGANDANDANIAVDGDAANASDADAANDVPDAPSGPACSAGTANCNGVASDGCETTLGTIANCGACGDACSTGANATALCNMGRCAIQCAPGFGDCDGDPRNGCEVDLSSSVAHCGRCANRCADGANALGVCNAGACGLSCNAGFGNCDANGSNGCEANLNTSTSHCSACNRACTAPANGVPVCSSAVCDFTCNAGTTRCGAQCVSTTDPAFGCGTCAACPVAPNAASMRCGGPGMCVPATCLAGYKLCGNQCVAINDANYGCTATSCSMCALSSGAASMVCVGTNCEALTCQSGYKRCGSACVANTLPQYGCGATASCLSCNVQNAAASCNLAGGCDYGTCNAGWRDLDGNRANGCETAAPSQVPGLRVWLSVSEPGSLTHTACTARANQQCLTRWNNLADASTPVLPVSSATPPWVMTPAGGGVANGVAVNIDPIFNGDGSVQSYTPARASGRSALINLSSLVGAQYTIYTVDMPVYGDRNYVLSCRPDSIFDTNGAFHIGNESASQLRLGYYNNDLNLAATTSLRARLLFAQQTAFGRTLTRTDLSGTVTGTDANTGLISRANNCSIGRGLADADPYSGLVREVLVFNRTLTVAEQNLVRTYITRRHGL